MWSGTVLSAYAIHMLVWIYLILPVTTCSVCAAILHPLLMRTLRHGEVCDLTMGMVVWPQIVPLGLEIFFFFFFFLKILFIWQDEHERAWAEGAAGRERGRSRLPMEQDAWYGTQLQDPGIIIWAKGRCLTNWATQVPRNIPIMYSMYLEDWEICKLFFWWLRAIMFTVSSIDCVCLWLLAFRVFYIVEKKHDYDKFWTPLEGF